MALRPVFRVLHSAPYVRETSVTFQYCPGLSRAQRCRCAQSLHAAYLQDFPSDDGAVLEISSFSDLPLGVQLSAFNLSLTLSDGRSYPLECLYQAGKCYADGTTCQDLLTASPRDARRIANERGVSPLTHFELDGLCFPIVPRTLFYDWLYISALRQKPELAARLLNYRAFTDIVFNPLKSTSCQARAAAKFVGLTLSGKLEEAMSSPEAFRRIAYL